MATFTWSPTLGATELWSIAANWIVAGAPASVMPAAGDTVFVAGDIGGPGTAAVINLAGASLAGAFQAATVNVTADTEFEGGPGAPVAVNANTLTVGTPTTDPDGAQAIFTASSTGFANATITSEIDLGVGRIGNGLGPTNPPTDIGVLQIETGNAPSDNLQADEANILLNDGVTLYDGKADNSAGYLLIANGGVVDVGASTTYAGYGTQALGILEIGSGGTFTSRGTTMIGYGSGALGYLDLQDPRLAGHPVGFFIQNGGELDIGVNGTGQVAAPLSTSPEVLNLANGASMAVGVSLTGSGTVAGGLTLSVDGDLNVGVEGIGAIGTNTGGDTLTVHGNVNVGIDGRGSLYVQSGTFGTDLTASKLDVGRGTGVGFVSVGASLSATSGDLTLNGSFVVGDAGSGRLTLGSGDTLTVNDNGFATDAVNVNEIGEQASGIGSVDLHSGALADLSQDSLIVGDEGTGTLSVFDSTSEAAIGLVNQGTLTIGRQAGSTGTVDVENGGRVAAWAAVLGVAGSPLDEDGFPIGPGAIGIGTVSGQESEWDVETTLVVGSGGAGTVTVTGGGTLLAGDPGNIATNGFVRGLTIGARGSVQAQFGGDLIVNGAATIAGTLQAGLIDASGAPSITFNNDGTSPLSVISGLMNVSDEAVIDDFTLRTEFHADTQGIALDKGTLEVQNTAFASIGMSSGDTLLIGDAPDLTGTLEPTGTLKILSEGTLDTWAATAGALDDVTGFALDDGDLSTWDVATTLTIGGAGNGTVTVSNGASLVVGSPEDTFQAQGLIVGDAGGVTGELDVESAAMVTVNGGMTIGNAGTGFVTVSDSATFTLDNFDGDYPNNSIGAQSTGSGTLVVTDDDTTLNATSTGLTIGDQGNGTLLVENTANATVGVAAESGVIVGNQATGSGAVSVETDGTLTSWQDSAGQVEGATGTITVDGSQSVYLAEVGLVLGNGGSGGLSVTNGGAVTIGDPVDTGQNQQIILGVSATASGTLTAGSASTLDVNGGMTVGNLGTGVATIAAGSSFTLDNFDGNYGISGIGEGVSSHGTLVVTGADTTMDASTLSLADGDQGDGTLTVENGASADVGSAIGGSLVVGRQAGATGTLSVLSGGTLDMSSLDIGAVSGASGSATIDGTNSTLGVSGSGLIGDGGTGAATVSNGGLLSIGQGVTIANATGGSGTLTLSGAGSKLDDSMGSMIVGDGGSGAVTISAGALLVVGTASAGDLLFGGSAGGSGNLTINGGGSLISDHAEIGGTATGVATVSGAGASWTDNGFMMIGAFGTGTLAIGGGGSVGVGTNATVADIAGSSGKLTVDGIGSQFATTGTLRLGSGKGQVGVTNGGVVTAGTLAIEAGGTLTVDAGSMVEIGPAAIPAAGGLVIEHGASGSGAGMISAAVRDDGTLTATGGTLEIAGSVIGTGTLDDSGTLRLDGSVANSLSLTFDPGTLLVGSPLAMDAPISNFITQDVIEFVGAYGTVTKDFSNGTLNVSGDGSLVGQFDLGPGYDAGNVTVKDTGGLVTITTSVACFAGGTRIATPHGGIAVERLAVGDAVLTVSGVPRRVVWIGRRRIDLTRHPAPDLAQPIRVRIDAFAPGVPCRDLRLSPDHAVLVDGVLIPIRLLINGTSIAREVYCRAVTWYHVELASHDVLLAENLPAESYLDTGNRAMFENGGQHLSLYPDLSNDQRRRELESCAPFAADAERVAPIWQRLTARATDLGWAVPRADPTTRDPALRVAAGGREIQPLARADGHYVFPLPRGASGARLVSRHFHPARQYPWIDDHRRLGVLVRRLTLRFGRGVEPIPLDHPALTSGWWQVERSGTGLWRWTDGDARLPLVEPDAALLELEIIGGSGYPLTAAARADRLQRVA